MLIAPLQFKGAQAKVPISGVRLTQKYQLVQGLETVNSFIHSFIHSFILSPCRGSSQCALATGLLWASELLPCLLESAWKMEWGASVVDLNQDFK